MASCITTKSLGNIISNFQLLPCSTPTISGVGNEKIPILGIIQLDFNVGSVSCSQIFHVADSMRYDIILGVDFMKSHNGCIMYSNNEGTLYIDGYFATNIQRISSNIAPLLSLLAAEELVIPARSHVACPAQISGCVVVGSMLMAEPIIIDQDKFIECKGSTCIIEAENPLYHISNHGDSDIIIPAGNPIARLSPIGSDIDLLCLNTIELHNHNNREQEDTSRIQVSAAQMNSNQNKPEDVLSNLGIDLSSSCLSDAERLELTSIIADNSDKFAKSWSELGCTSLHSHKIETGGAAPIRSFPYKTSPEIKEEISRQVKELLDLGIIYENDDCQWCSPIVMCRKADGVSWRMAVDYRKINAVTKPMIWPLPNFTEVVETLGHAKAKIFSVLDLKGAFYQVPLDPETKEKSSFITHDGVYTFNRCSFGLMNMPMSFQAVMSKALKGISWKHCLAFIDDIIIFSETWEEHKTHLRQVFDRLKQANLKLHPDKCRFACSEVPYLGYKISDKGLSVNIDKVKAVLEFPVPTCVTNVRSFLGMANYYSRFIPKYSNLANPLHELLTLKKDQDFVWQEKHQAAFVGIRDALISAPILTLPNPENKPVVYTDASDIAIGYILGQIDPQGSETVIEYGGRAYRGAEQNYSITHKEGLALVTAVDKYKHYLADKHFLVLTDHISLKWLKSIKDTKGRLGRWSLLLQPYDFDIKHKSGKTNTNADCLSRRHYEQTEPQTVLDIADNLPVLALNLDESGCSETNTQSRAPLKCSYEIEYGCQTIQSITTAAVDFTDFGNEMDISMEQKDDSNLMQYIEYLANNKLPEDDKTARLVISKSQDMVISDGVLYNIYQPRGKNVPPIKQLVVPSNLKTTVMKSYHGNHMAGHQGIDRTYQIIRRKYFWQSMYQDVVNYVKSCEVCQQSKRDFRKDKIPPLQPLPVAEPFGRIHMDFLGPIKDVDGYKHILLIVDSFTKWPECFPLKTQEATEVSKILYNEIICRYGAPSAIVTDKAQNFMSSLLTELCKLFQIKKINTTPYHPQTNSACERMNSTIITQLRAMTDKNQQNWPDLLPSIMAAYRATPATKSTLFSPSQLVFGKEMSFPVDNELLPVSPRGPDYSAYMNGLISNLECAREVAKGNIRSAQKIYKSYYDQSHKAALPKFTPGDRVWLYCSKTEPGLTPKLCKRWLGPYMIISAYTNNTYTLRRCSDLKPVKGRVNALRLKPFFSSNIMPEASDVSTCDPADADQFDSEPTPVPANLTPHVPAPVTVPQPVAVGSPGQAGDFYIVERLLGSFVKQGTRYFKVKWKGYKERTWEPAENIPDELIADYYSRKRIKK